jgi:hypothetical protein
MMYREKDTLLWVAETQLELVQKVLGELWQNYSHESVYQLYHKAGEFRTEIANYRLEAKKNVEVNNEA